MSVRLGTRLLEISQMARATRPNLRPVGSASSQGTDCRPWHATNMRDKEETF